MKNKLLTSCLFLATILFPSCKKEHFFNITGQWVSMAVYTIQDNGSYGWWRTNGFQQFFEFHPDGRFISWTDVPGGGGTYNYDSRLDNLVLNYEVDPYRSSANTEIFKVEELTYSRLIISYSFSGNVFKTEFSRIKN